MMSEIRDHDGREFLPWLLQVLEMSYGHPNPSPRCTVEEARTAWEKKEDPLQHGANLPRKVAQYIDDRTGWHYMGNAEYEFGSIPAAIGHLFDQELVAHTFVIPKDKLPKNYSRGNMYFHEPAKKLAELKKRPKEKQDPKLMKELKALINAGPEQDLTLYYLGPKKYVEKMPAILDKLCKDELRTKAGSRFNDLADPISEYDRKYHGWLCLDFPFWMTKDRAFFEQVCALYGVTP